MICEPICCKVLAAVAVSLKLLRKASATHAGDRYREELLLLSSLQLLVALPTGKSVSLRQKDVPSTHEGTRWPAIAISPPSASTSSPAFVSSRFQLSKQSARMNTLSERAYDMMRLMLSSSRLLCCNSRQTLLLMTTADLRRWLIALSTRTTSGSVLFCSLQCSSRSLLKALAELSHKGLDKELTPATATPARAAKIKIQSFIANCQSKR